MDGIRNVETLTIKPNGAIAFRILKHLELLPIRISFNASTYKHVHKHFDRIQIKPFEKRCKKPGKADND